MNAGGRGCGEHGGDSEVDFPCAVFDPRDIFRGFRALHDFVRDDAEREHPAEGFGRRHGFNPAPVFDEPWISYVSWPSTRYVKKSEKVVVWAEGVAEKPLTILYLDFAKDIAVYELPADIVLDSFPYAMGNSDDLRLGNFTYLVGYPSGRSSNVREGIVGRLSFTDDLSGALNKDPRSYFVMTNGIVSGDSGGAAVAIRDGAYELVGLSAVAYLSREKLGAAIRVNVIRNAIVHDCRACPADLKKVFGIR